jgi:hypothetical protein
MKIISTRRLRLKSCLALKIECETTWITQARAARFMGSGEPKWITTIHHPIDDPSRTSGPTSRVPAATSRDWLEELIHGFRFDSGV